MTCNAPKSATTTPGRNRMSGLRWRSAMSEQRLDLSDWEARFRAFCNGLALDTPTFIKELHSEALRAQASEDALRERVRVLEAIIRRGAESEEIIRLTSKALGGGKESEG